MCAVLGLVLLMALGALSQEGVLVVLALGVELVILVLGLVIIVIIGWLVWKIYKMKGSWVLKMYTAAYMVLVITLVMVMMEKRLTLGKTANIVVSLLIIICIVWVYGDGSSPTREEEKADPLKSTVNKLDAIVGKKQEPVVPTSDEGTFFDAFFGGDCWIYTAEIVLLLVLIITELYRPKEESTSKEHPEYVSEMLAGGIFAFFCREQYSALILIMTSALTIAILNAVLTKKKVLKSLKRSRTATKSS